MAFVLNDGQGTLHKVTEKKTERSPDYYGELNVGGKMWRLSGWIKQGKNGKWLSLNAEEAALVTAPRAPPPRAATIDVDGDIPF